MDRGWKSSLKVSAVLGIVLLASTAPVATTQEASPKLTFLPPEPDAVIEIIAGRVVEAALEKPKCAAILGGKEAAYELARRTVLVRTWSLGQSPRGIVIAVAVCPDRIAWSIVAARIVGPVRLGATIIHEMRHLTLCGEGLSDQREHRRIDREMRGCVWDESWN